MENEIAIIGAGLGGLTLARVLQVNNVPATVYEAEATSITRAQGGLLDIHEETGQQALRDANLFDEFTRLIRPGEDAKRVTDRHGNVLFDNPGGNSEARPEVDRGELRKMLIESLPQGTVRWGRKVTSVATDGHRKTITMADGASVTADVVVGADGAWSKVRPLLAEGKPAYTGTCYTEIALLENVASHQASVDAVGRGTLMAVEPGGGILVHRYPDGTVHGYAAVNRPEEWVRSIDFSNPQAGLAELAKQFDGWAPHLVALITDSDTEPILRPIYALPVGYQWDRVPALTLLGDAAHLMSPFAGEGANLAIYDGAELAKALVGNPDDVEAALAAYERDLFPRSAEIADQSARNLAQFFGDGAPQSVAQLFEHVAQMENQGSR